MHLDVCLNIATVKNDNPDTKAQLTIQFPGTENVARRNRSISFDSFAKDVLAGVHAMSKIKTEHAERRTGS